MTTPIASVSPSNPNGSTGPRTDAGKAICARNAIKHGVFSPSITFSSAAEQEEFDTCLAGYTKTYHPVGQPENDLVLVLAIATYKNIRLERASLQQEVLLADRLREKLRKDGIDPGDLFEGYLLEAQTTDKTFQDYMRRSRHLTSTITCRLRDLMKLQKERRHLAVLRDQANLRAAIDKQPAETAAAPGVSGVPDIPSSDCDALFADAMAAVFADMEAFQSHLAVVARESVSAEPASPIPPALSEVAQSR